MKTTLFFVVFLLYTTFSFAQIEPHTPWTWMKGDNTIDQPGVYGTQGIANATNKPGARNFSTTWRDAGGKLWLFGGWGYGASGSGYLNDLWKYDPHSNRWTWVNGNTNSGHLSIYGVQGTASTVSKPGGTYGSVSWTDVNGNLWLFGGFGYTSDAFGFINTLWKYDLSLNKWTWVNGDSTVNQPGVYGTKGSANAGNKPGARYGSQTWIDATGNLWLYGGYGYDGDATGILNDIWKYDPSTNEWTWINGNNAIELIGVYGIKGVADAANRPGARYVSTSWTDENGSLWLFGGYGYDENNAGNLDDIWKYDPSANVWTWISGDKIIDQPGVYGNKGVANAANKPGARYISSSWKDVNGDLWLFGGYGYDATQPGYLNDLWRYNPAANGWTWIKGDNTVDQVGIYGVQGMADSSSKSGARTGSVSWTDGNGNLWLFGGYGFDGSTSGVLNDLWRISDLQAILPLHLLYFNGAQTNEIVHLQWQTEQETGFSHFNIQRSFDGINFTTIGTVNGSGNNNRNDYTYYDNDLRTRQVQKAFYRLQLMDKDGRFTYSKILMFDWKQANLILTVFPNPAVNTLNLSFDQDKTGKVMISITDMKGVTVKKQAENILAGRASINIDVSTLSPGAYLLSIINSDGAIQQKFIKQ